MSVNRPLRGLEIPVTNLLKKVFTKERFSASLDVGVGEEGLYQRGRSGGLDIRLALESCPDGIRVKGVIRGWVTLECTRCLEEYKQHLDMEVDEFYCRPDMAVVGEDGRRLPTEIEIPEEGYVIEKGRIDLYPLVNDAVMLSLPIKRLCSESCRGICQICGRNLNLGECGCEREEIDPRLEVLRTLLDRDEG